MIISGIQKTSLVDYPGYPCSVIFLQGCNFNCPFCHNKELIGHMCSKPISILWILDFFKNRMNLIKHVVITGGEPTINDSLYEFLHRLKKIGINVKLDTNGSNPDFLKTIVRQKLVNYFAMDIKAPVSSYDKLAGVKVDINSILESIDIISKSNIHHQFRTTYVPHLLSENDMMEIKKMMPFGANYKIQDYHEPNQKR